MNNPWVIAFVFLLIGLIAQRIFDELIKPNLKIEVGEEAIVKQQGRPATKFLHVKVINRKRNIFLRIIRKNNTVSYAKVSVIFRFADSRAEILKINGRWTSKKEPVNYQTNQADIGEALLIPREAIPAGEEVNVAIALKEEGKNEFYAFNNESYLHNWKHSDYELIEKEYVLEVNILSEGNEWHNFFSIVNSGKRLSNFRLT